MYTVDSIFVKHFFFVIHLQHAWFAMYNKSVGIVLYTILVFKNKRTRNGYTPSQYSLNIYSVVTDLARFLGKSTSNPLLTAR